MQAKKIGLAMTGGGARGAYQAGVLKRIGEIPHFKKEKYNPFKIIGGASAGAINGCALATGCQEFSACTDWLSKLWGGLSPEDIFRADLTSLIPKVGRWIRDLSLGPMLQGGNAHALLDATPLHQLLKKHLPFNCIEDNLKKGHLNALSVAATSYTSGKTYFFVQAQGDHQLWNKSRRIAIDAKIDAHHVAASAAIPIIFQPVAVKTASGSDFYGDGCMRLPTPLSPVIRLGAERILAIGVRSQHASDMTAMEEGRLGATPSLAQILGVILNAIFLDHLDADVEHLQRLNAIVREGKLREGGGSGVAASESMKSIEALVVTPSCDLGQLASEYADKLPKTVRYLMAGLGTQKSPSTDLISYLLFDSAYTQRLIEMGYSDAEKRIDEIESFLMIK